jgi:AcrR family transcriptional regulator
MLGSDDNTVNIKPYHHGDLRDQLLETGMRLLEGRRSEDLALREVARAVGVSATAVYRHFPDKEALLRAMAARGFDMMGEAQAAAAKRAGSKGAFAAVGGAYVRFALQHPGVFRLMFSSAPPYDLFSITSQDVPMPMRLLREHVMSLSPLSFSDEARKVIAMRAWAIVHGLAVLALDRMIVLDDNLIDAVIDNAARPGGGTC